MIGDEEFQARIKAWADANAVTFAEMTEGFRQMGEKFREIGQSAAWNGTSEKEG